jgi:hypothetical protein
MSGILPGIAFVNNFDNNGELMRGALLRIYAAGTNTPVTAYKDSALTAGQEQPWPIPADSAARLPIFYLADGAYRVRLSTDDGGYIAYDVPYIEAVGPSSGGGGGGGGGVAPEVLFRTGYLLPMLGSGILTGFVRLNGRTIGSAVSGATERANADVQGLFEYLWGEFDNTVCPVLGGRGSSSTADFTAGKQLTLIDGRGRTFFGADGMGASRANRLTNKTFATADTIGTYGGTEAHALIRAELPNFQPTFTGTPMTATGGLPNVAIGNVDTTTGGGGFEIKTVTGRGQSFTTDPFTPAGAIDALGDGTSFGTASPGFIGTWYVKL